MKKFLVGKGAAGLGLVLPSFFLLLLLVIIPTIGAIRESLVTDAGGFTFSRYTLLFTDHVMLSDMIYTLEITLISTVATIVLCYPLAVYLRFGKGIIAEMIRKIYFIPMFIPAVIASYSLIAMFGEHGWVDTLMHHLGASSYPKIIFDTKGLLLSQLWFHIPFTTMLLVSSLEGIPNSVIESARDVGANGLQIMLQVVVPLTKKTILVASTFIFMGVIGGYTAPYMLGPNAPQMLGVLMPETFGTYLDPAQASAIAVFMFVLCTGVGAFYIRSMVQEDKTR